jgi:hypothetical protein
MEGDGHSPDLPTVQVVVEEGELGLHPAKKRVINTANSADLCRRKPLRHAAGFDFIEILPSVGTLGRVAGQASLPRRALRDRKSDSELEAPNCASFSTLLGLRQLATRIFVQPTLLGKSVQDD